LSVRSTKNDVARALLPERNAVPLSDHLEIFNTPVARIIRIRTSIFSALATIEEYANRV
jgi:hypothetical protein